MRNVIEFAQGSLGVFAFIGFFGLMALGGSADDIGFSQTMASGLGTAIKIYIALLVGVLLLILVLINVERTQLKNMLRSFVDRRDYSRGEELGLAAPEAYMLLRGGDARSGETFKLGLLQAVATGNVVVEAEDQRPDDIREIYAAPIGSLAALAGNKPTPMTVKECVEQIKETYGDPDGFTHQEVIPRLVAAGYATSTSGFEGVTLTPEGERVKEVVEGRVGAALYDMQEQGGPTIDGDPKRALFAGVVMATAGMPMALTAAGAREVDQTDISRGQRAYDDGYVGNNYMTSWYMMRGFDSAYGEVDSVGGDGGGFGGDGDGGDGGDGGGDGGGGD